MVSHSPAQTQTTEAQRSNKLFRSSLMIRTTSNGSNR